VTEQTLVEEYATFVNDSKILQTTGQIDMSDIDFIYPTRLALLGNLILNNPHTPYLMPNDELVARYIYTSLFNPDTTYNRTYIPMVRLPSDPQLGKEKLQRVYDIQDRQGGVIGGNDAFTYVVGEFVGNMYDHAKFTNASIIGQRYPTKGFVEISFLDDGITIPTSFLNNGQQLGACEAIIEAINGNSTIHQPKRGFGLSTSIRILLEGLDGKVLVVSGSGAVYLGRDLTQYFTLDPTESLQGTLISIRIPYPSEPVSIYPYVE
jgi:hypothetical protein